MALHHCRLGGVALEGAEKERYNEIQQQLAQIATKFSNNVSL
jgi:oligopeptidase A